MRLVPLKTLLAAALLAPAASALFAQETTPAQPATATPPAETPAAIAPATTTETLTFQHLSPKVVADSVKMFTARFGAAGGNFTATVSEDGKSLVVQGRADEINQLKEGIKRVDIQGGDAILTAMAQRFSGTGSVPPTQSPQQPGERPRFRSGGAGNVAGGAPATSGNAPQSGDMRGEPRRGPVAASEERVGPIILVDESLPQVISLLEKFSGKSVLRTQTLPVLKINFTGTETLTREKAVLALETLLAINGVSIIPQGDDFLKATPAGTAGVESPPLYLASTLSLPPSERIIARLFSLNHTTAQIVEPALKAVTNAARGGSVIAMPSSNAVLFTDSVAAVQQAEKIVENLDMPNTVLFFPLKNVRASVVKKQLQTLQQGGLKTILPGDIAVESDDNTNQIMVVTTRQNESKIRDILARMDSESSINTVSDSIGLKHVDVATAFTALETFIIRKANSPGSAGNTQSTQRLQSSGGTGTTQTKDTGPFKSYGLSTRPQISGTGTQSNDQQRYYYVPPQQQNQQTSNEPVGAFSDYLTVVGDERSNSLIVLGTPGDVKQIRDIVAKIDVMLAQVRIEAVIVEVTLSDQSASGLSTLGFGYMTAAGANSVISNGDYKFNTSTPALPGGSAPPFAVTGSIKDLSLDVVFNKAVNDSRVRVLSAPLISTSHNKNAHITVSRQQPIISGTTTDISNAGARSSSVSYEDIGLTLNVTPRVGSDGSVELDVAQTVKNVVGTTTIDGNDQPIIANREAVSYLTAKHNETIVLAGLQSYRETNSSGKVWLLGDIPIIGKLFQPETKDNERSEIVIFLKPHVIEPGKEKEELASAPGLQPGALTRADAKGFLETGRFGAVSLTPEEYEALEYLRKKQNNQAGEYRERETSASQAAEAGAAKESK